MRVLRAWKHGLRVSSLGALVAMATISAIHAEPIGMWKSFPAVDELRMGVLATDLEDSKYNSGGAVINGEALFGRFRPNYSDSLRQFVFNPRPHLGFSFNPSLGGVSQAYAGLTWDLKLNEKLFFEASLGGTVHDGATESYGCSVMFRESASFGVNLTQSTRLMATVDHSSNGGLCDPNKGLTNAGLRLGYRF